jgi:hypothetical protein
MKILEENEWQSEKKLCSFGRILALPGFGRTVRKGGIHEEVKMMCTETKKICAVIICIFTILSLLLK